LTRKCSSSASTIASSSGRSEPGTAAANSRAGAMGRELCARCPPFHPRRPRPSLLGQICPQPLGRRARWSHPLRQSPSPRRGDPAPLSGRGLRMNRHSGTDDEGYTHEPVMLDEIVELLTATPDGLVVDPLSAGVATRRPSFRPPRPPPARHRPRPGRRVGRRRRLDAFGSRARVCRAALTVWRRSSQRRRPSNLSWRSFSTSG